MKRLPPNHPILTQVASKLCEVHLNTGEPERCRTLIAHIAQALDTAAGEPHPKVVLQANNLASILLDAGQTSGSRMLYGRCLSVWDEPGDWKHQWARFGVALCDVHEGSTPEVASSIIGDLESVLGERNERVERARERLESVIALTT